MSGSDDEQDPVDLSIVLAPLSKEQLELMVAKLIARHEEIGEEVLELAKQPVDMELLKESVASACALEETSRVQELLSLLGQAGQYAAASDPQNALVVGEEVTGHLVKCCLSDSKEVDDADLEGAMREMEETWGAVVKACKGDVKLLEQAEKPLNKWKTSLTKKFGPIFSDQLRLAARLKSEGSSTTKRKGDDDTGKGAKKQKA